MAEKKAKSRTQADRPKSRVPEFRQEREEVDVQPSQEVPPEEQIGDLSEAQISVGPGATPHRGVTVANPSETSLPYMSPEEQTMEMVPVVVGPPAYGSPDPSTLAGRLVSLDDHPLAATGQISEDYGRDVVGLKLPSPVEGGYATQPLVPTEEAVAEAIRRQTGESDLEADTRGADATSYSDMSKDELMELAQKREIEGRSQMSKDDLVQAHEAYDAA